MSACQRSGVAWKIGKALCVQVDIGFNLASEAPAPGAPGPLGFGKTGWPLPMPALNSISRVVSLLRRPGAPTEADAKT
jgi:hypothetical protein